MLGPLLTREGPWWCLLVLLTQECCTMCCCYLLLLLLQTRLQKPGAICNTGLLFNERSQVRTHTHPRFMVTCCYTQPTCQRIMLLLQPTCQRIMLLLQVQLDCSAAC